MPQMLLADILATPAGKTPTLVELQSMVEHAMEHESKIATLWDNQNLPESNWQSVADQRGLVLEKTGAANTYEGDMLFAVDNSLYEGARIMLYGVSLTNDSTAGFSTLDVGTTDGVVRIKKKTFDGPDDLASGDIPLYAADLYYSAMHGAWILQNPTSMSVANIVQTTIPTAPAAYADGDLIFIVE